MLKILTLLCYFVCAASINETVYIFGDTMDWHTAYQTCKGNKSHLARVEIEDRVYKLKDTVVDANRLWVDARRKIASNTFINDFPFPKICCGSLNYDAGVLQYLCKDCSEPVSYLCVSDFIYESTQKNDYVNWTAARQFCSNRQGLPLENNTQFRAKLMDLKKTPKPYWISDIRSFQPILNESETVECGYWYDGNVHFGDCSHTGHLYTYCFSDKDDTKKTTGESTISTTLTFAENVPIWSTRNWVSDEIYNQTSPSSTEEDKKISKETSPSSTEKEETSNGSLIAAVVGAVVGIVIIAIIIVVIVKRSREKRSRENNYIKSETHIKTNVIVNILPRNNPTYDDPCTEVNGTNERSTAFSQVHLPSQDLESYVLSQSDIQSCKNTSPIANAITEEQDGVGLYNKVQKKLEAGVNSDTTEQTEDSQEKYDTLMDFAKATNAKTSVNVYDRANFICLNHSDYDNVTWNQC